MILTSRRSREKRESQVLWIRLTQISRISRRALTIARAFLRDVYTRQSRQARAKRRAICEIREICERKRISVREKTSRDLRDSREKDISGYPCPSVGGLPSVRENEMYLLTLKPIIE